MASDDITDVPKLSRSDLAYTAAKGALSMVPLAGTALAEVFALVIAAPLARRRDEWMEEVAERLVALEGKVAGFKLEDLSTNDAFVSTVFQATAAAVKTHHPDKREALQNAVLNTAVGIRIDSTLQEIFVQLVDRLTPWHLRVLAFFNDPGAAMGRSGRAPQGFSQEWSSGAPAHLLEAVYPELGGQREFYDLVVRDLFASGLMNTESVHTTMTGNGMVQRRTTELGSQFLAYISRPVAEGA